MKKAAEIDLKEDRTFLQRKLPDIIIGLGLVSGLAHTIAASVFLDKYLEEQGWDLTGGDRVTKTYIALCTVILVLMVYISNKLAKKKEKTGLSWVDFLKNLIRNKKSRINKKAISLLKKKDPKLNALTKLTIKPDGTLDKSALKRFIYNSLRKKI